jgi:alkaline phosphatase D
MMSILRISPMMREGPLWVAIKRTGEYSITSTKNVTRLKMTRFYDELVESANRGATWRIIGSQIVFSRINYTADWATLEVPLNYDAWDGYMANKNRTLKTLYVDGILHHLETILMTSSYDNDIGNNIFIAGDSHANWVSDLVWLDEADYDPDTGAGSLGAEFGGTAVSSTGPCDEEEPISACNELARNLVSDNEELQWSEGWYRGYFELHISPEKVDAHFFGTPSLQTRNGYEVSLANFTVEAGGNRLSRPIAGGTVEDGHLRDGSISMTRLTLDTNTGKYFVHNFTRVTLLTSYDE